MCYYVFDKTIHIILYSIVNMDHILFLIFNANPGLINPPPPPPPPPEGQQDMQNWKMHFFWHYPLIMGQP